MKSRLIIVAMTFALILLSICLLFSKQILLPAGVYVSELRNTDGSMTFTVRTITYNGSYHPRNVGAIWITNSQNQFVKTIKIWASEHRSSLVKWVQSSGNNTTGAITSATLSNHQLHSVTWNGKNYQNAAITDGNYNVNIEYTESSSTTSNPGKFKTVTFNKGTTAVDNVPTSDSFFSDMHLVWTPVIVANEDNQSTPGTIVLNQNYPNPFSNSTEISYNLDKNSKVNLNVYNTKGQLVAKLVDNYQTKGWNKTSWNGKQQNGQKATPGKYICELQINGLKQTKLMTLSK